MATVPERVGTGGSHRVARSGKDLGPLPLPRGGGPTRTPVLRRQRRMESTGWRQLGHGRGHHAGAPCLEPAPGSHPGSPNPHPERSLERLRGESRPDTLASPQAKVLTQGGRQSPEDPHPNSLQAQVTQAMTLGVMT